MSCGLVLAGGGARGAYEAGILYYLFVEAPAELREAVDFSVLSGTSIGALNISALGATIHQPSVGVRRLVDMWRNLDLEQVLRIGLADLVGVPGWLLGRNSRQSIFPGDPVKTLIEGAIDWNQLHVNLGDPKLLLDAMTVSATRVPTGKTVVFYETSDGRPRKFSRDPNVRPVYSRLGPEHARASAAIPFVFPAVPIDAIPYADGGLRQNTPLSPALRLGSDRLLVVGLGHEMGEMDHHSEPPDWRGKLSSPVFMLAKVLNALMLDHVDYDIVRMEHVNRLLEDGEMVFGEQFITRLNAMVTPIRGASYRKVPHVVLRPSQDLGKMAADYVRGSSMRKHRSVAARVIRTLSRLESREEADLTSYLLFDGGYCERLIRLGAEDAERRLDDLLRLFTE